MAKNHQNRCAILTIVMKMGWENDRLYPGWVSPCFGCFKRLKCTRMPTRKLFFESYLIAWKSISFLKVLVELCYIPHAFSRDMSEDFYEW